MDRKYRLTRLPDLKDGQVNFEWGPIEDDNNILRNHVLIDWDWNWIRKEAAKLEIGESKIYSELF